MPSFDDICKICKIDGEIRDVIEKCLSLRSEKHNAVFPPVDEFDILFSWPYLVETYKHYLFCLSCAYLNVSYDRYLEVKFKYYRRKVDEILDDETMDEREQKKQRVSWTKLMKELQKNLAENYAGEVKELWIKEINVGVQELQALKLEDNQSDEEARSGRLAKRVAEGIYWLLQMDVSINSYARFLDL